MSMPVGNDLTAEERAIAERLARLEVQGAPSPAIDARILAAARTATAPRPRHAPRWPLAFGLAASLLLVAGIAWRMLPQPGVDAGRAPSKPSRSRADAASAIQRPMRTTAAEPSGETAETAPSDDTAAAAAPAMPAAPAAPSPKMPAEEPPVVFDAPAPMSAPAPMVELPPPVPAKPSPAAPEAKTAAAPPSPSPADATLPADEAERASGNGVAARGNVPQSDEPIDATPPATADAPEVRDAWLLRIRALFDRGDIAGGRASLRAFAQRYPDYPLPEDLRALLR